MRDVKTISSERVLSTARYFIASGARSAVVNRTPAFDLEPTVAWGGAERLITKAALPVTVRIDGSDVVFERSAQ